jgi:hypothetical protein
MAVMASKARPERRDLPERALKGDLLVPLPAGAVLRGDRILFDALRLNNCRFIGIQNNPVRLTLQSANPAR